MRIAVDLLGGDDAPAVVVDGALRAFRADPDLRLLLVGPAEVADELIAALRPDDRDRIAVRPVRQAVAMTDDSAGALDEPDIARIAVDLLGGDDAPAVVVDGALRACWADLPADHSHQQTDPRWAGLSQLTRKEE